MVEFLPMALLVLSSAYFFRVFPIQIFALFRPGTISVAGAEDGSLLFFDLERDTRPCINKLLGHSGPVIALGFNNDESLLASADEKNQIIIWRKS